MEAISPTVWFPVVTLVVGLLLKAVFDALTENRKAAVDKASRVEKRKEIILLQRIDSQRKALGDLQIAIADMVRSTNLLQMHDIENHKKTGTWGEVEAPADLDELSRSNFRAVTLMKVRVCDEKVRQSANDLTARCSKMVFTKTKEDAHQVMVSVAILYSEINETIGESLRALEQDEQALLI